MYPDTDLPPKRINDERLDKLKLTLPPLFWENERWYRKLKIPTDVIQPLAHSPYCHLFKSLVNDLKINPTLASVALIQYPKRLKKLTGERIQFDVESFEKIFSIYETGLISQEGIYLAMQSLVREGKFKPPKKYTKAQFSSDIKIVNKEIKSLKIRKPKKKAEIMMGLVMKKVRGRIDGKLVAERIGFSGKGKK